MIVTRGEKAHHKSTHFLIPANLLLCHWPVPASPSAAHARWRQLVTSVSSLCSFFWDCKKHIVTGWESKGRWSDARSLPGVKSYYTTQVVLQPARADILQTTASVNLLQSVAQKGV
ncbi:hypothetical protein RRG08_038059 [Elysia crispata]|uniref:Uncharacterized protein n=1 Tax=Elysia crispata TaxID=231223 RepID=A0AAE1DPT9_9GAST|nr:hypothetical protein RRG08_038059 [Elysia crispata]